MPAAGHEEQKFDNLASKGSIRWHRTLAFRLAALVNITVAGVLGLFWCVDYAREWSVHIRRTTERLAEEARVLRVTNATLGDPARFQSYLDDFCHQMDLRSSPGHHIILADQAGSIVARAHVRANAALEAAMLDAYFAGSERFRHRGEEYVVAGLSNPDAKSIVVAQSLAPAYAIIRAQALSRAASLTALVVVIFLLTTVVIWRWVRRPVRGLVDCTHSVRKGNLATRAEPVGPPEIRFLASGFNAMIEALDRHEQGRLRELDRARRIQRRLLPNDDITIQGAKTAFQYEPTEPIGGDYLDIFQLNDGRWLIAIADVCGHGVAAALLATLFKTHARHQSIACTGPSEMLEAINKELCAVLSDEEFVTCLIVVYDAADGSLEYANAGHPPGLIVNVQGQIVAHLKCTSSVLGVWPNATFGSGKALLQAGDRLVLYTDGLVECHGSDQQLFGHDRLAHAISRTAMIDPTDQAAQLLQQARAFTAEGPLDDDVSILILQRLKISDTC